MRVRRVLGVALRDCKSLPGGRYLLVPSASWPRAGSALFGMLDPFDPFLVLSNQVLQRAGDCSLNLYRGRLQVGLTCRTRPYRRRGC